MSKIKTFLLKLVPTKRKLIQLFSFLLYNAYLKGFFTGKIYKGESKAICAPGFNCYSCPGAITSCPLGTLQNSLARANYSIPYYIIGILLLYGLILGRTICGFLCPFGLLQELLYKIKTFKIRKSKVTRILSYFKYILLGAMVISIPFIYSLATDGIPLPAFCKYVCPVGTLEGGVFLLANRNNFDYYSMLGWLFNWKMILLVLILTMSVFMYRFFCRFLCPLGAIYGFFSKLSLIGVYVNKGKCDNCGACVKYCKMDVQYVGDHECIQCGECKKVCHAKAIDFKKLKDIIKNSENSKTTTNTTESVEDYGK